MFFPGFQLQAQSKDGLRHDIEGWSQVSIKTNIAKDWSLHIDYAHRFRDTLKTVKSRFFDIGAECDLMKEIEIGLHYRMFLKDENGFAGKRWMPQISFEPRFGNFRIRWRNRLDIENYEPAKWEKIWRNQIRFKFDSKSSILKPSITYELFHNVSKNMMGAFKNRLMFSLDLELAKKHTIEIQAGAQQEWSVRKPQFDKIFAISYQIDL